MAVSNDDRRLRLVGRDVEVVFTPDSNSPFGGSKITLSGEQNSFSLSRTMDTADVTAGNEKTRFHQATIEDLTWDMTVLYSTQPFHEYIQPGAFGILDIYPKGNAGGNPWVSFETLITDYSPDFPFDDAIQVSMSGRRQGDMIKDFGTTVPS